MEWIIYILIGIGAFNLGRMTKAYPPPEVMVARLIKMRTEKKLLEMTKEALEKEVDRVSKNLLERHH